MSERHRKASQASVSSPRHHHFTPEERKRSHASARSNVEYALRSTWNEVEERIHRMDAMATPVGHPFHEMAVVHTEVFLEYIENAMAKHNIFPNDGSPAPQVPGRQ
jgi:hypothetical protein